MIDPEEFIRAREVFREKLLEDPELLMSYEANVAMLLHDQYNRADFRDYATRMDAAYSVLSLIFGFKEG